MSHWAEIDETNTVIRVLTGNNDDSAGDEGYLWLIDNLGGNWIQTSYHGNFRGTYAGIGFSYNPTEDIFVTPQPYPSWHREGSFWYAPVPYPTDGQLYTWNEATLSWDVVDETIPE
jgi:hypothetical protein